VRLCRAADLDDFLDMSIENFAGDIISFAICADNRYISGLRPNSNIICYINLSTTSGERNMKGQIHLTILYISSLNVILSCLK
jgi:hypothetical protein